MTRRKTLAKVFDILSRPRDMTKRNRSFGRCVADLRERATIGGMKSRRRRITQMSLWLKVAIAVATAMGILCGGVGQLLQGVEAVLH
jgi:hypothetical protein